MSATGLKMPLHRAQEIAASFIDEFFFGVDEVMVAGSIRRRREEVGDVEILVPASAAFIKLQRVSERPSSLFRALDCRFLISKWGPLYKQLERVDDGVMFDLFVFQPANRGSQMVIRTGPRGFSTHFVTQLREHGCEHRDGYVWRDGHPVPCTDEEAAFKLAGMTYVKPEDRDQFHHGAHG